MLGACVQNLCLYGSQICTIQSYWSMKYHSIIMESLDKYAGLGFGGNSFVFDDIKWYRGRAFPYAFCPKLMIILAETLISVTISGSFFVLKIK